MSVLSTANLYGWAKQAFQVGASRFPKFEISFLSAYNDCLFDLYNDALIDEPTLLTDMATDSELELRYLPQLKVGLKFFMQTSGEWIRGDDIDKYAQLNWNTAKGVISNAIVRAVEDAGTYTGPWGDTA